MQKEHDRTWESWELRKVALEVRAARGRHGLDAALVHAAAHAEEAVHAPEPHDIGLSTSFKRLLAALWHALSIFQPSISLDISLRCLSHQFYSEVLSVGRRVGVRQQPIVHRLLLPQLFRAPPKQPHRMAAQRAISPWRAEVDAAPVAHEVREDLVGPSNGFRLTFQAPFRRLLGAF